jgi:PHD/YefM family antitoxin component YafN of YafNO toxin-antitoxin module
MNEAEESPGLNQITGQRSSPVSLSEERRRGIQETDHLLSVPGMLESIRAGMAQSLGQTSTNPGW